MKKFLYLAMMIFASIVARAADNPTVVALWPECAPNSNGLDPAKEVVTDSRASATVNATLTIYNPKRPNGVAIVACPGGGYAHLALAHEGKDMAQWMNAMGITYAVLTYRMPGGGHREVPLSDAQQAISYMRSHAAELGIRTDKIGIMGASAGGHLAASAACLSTGADNRPDFQILFYPVITMEKGVTHQGSRDNLLGKEATDELVALMSLENRVDANTPQAFIMVSADDTAVPVANSLRYATALADAKVPFSLHVYPTGGHGWGYRDSFPYKRQWTGELEAWLRNRIIR